MSEYRLCKLLTVKEKEVELAEAERDLIRYDLQKANEAITLWTNTALKFEKARDEAKHRSALLEAAVRELWHCMRGYGCSPEYWLRQYPILNEVVLDQE